MSFILDALKKSESDRQRQSGPALYEMRVARPARLGLPVWAIAIVALLGVNLAVIAWLLVHHASQPAQTPAPAQTSAAPGTAQTPAPAPAGTPPAAPAYYGQQQPQPAPYPYYGQQGYPNPQQMPPQMAGQPMQQPYPPGAYPGYQGNYPQGAYPPAQGYPQAYGQPQPGAYPGQAPGQAPGQGMAGSGMASGTELESTGNPDDYAPAEPASSGGGRVIRGTANGLPLYPDPEAAAVAGLPRLHLDFHSYDANPQRRFVMINTHGLREGQVSPEGVRVDEITPDGASISRGQARYFLSRP